jgi:NADPH2 dehydrogenase
MCMYSAPEDGKATSWHNFHYRTRAQGGAALIIQEATAVEARGRISSFDLGIWDDSHISGLKELTNGIKAEGAVPGIQLAHAGRKCNVSGADVIAPSPINFDPDDSVYVTPREMNKDDIDTVVEAFRNAAERAVESGYQILEIHGAHGYLINEFLSPLTNTRGDSFGGPLKNRAEFLRRIIQAVRSVWKEENPLMLRVSALDYAEGGNQPEALAEIINLVKGEGIDIVHVSSGGVVPHVKIPLKPAYQIPAARIIKDLTGLPVVGGGLITQSGEVGEILKNQDSDLVFLGRELLRNPYFPLISAQEVKENVEYWPRQYLRAK